MIRILGIESSCDECSASVVSGELGTYKVLSVSTYSQIKEHAPFGGVVPEVASRNHLLQMQPVMLDALEKAKMKWTDIDAVAVTNRPGLIGALLVGVTAAKALAYTLKKPLIPVHHLEGHLMSVFLSRTDENPWIPFPTLVLLASGGHTQLHAIQDSPSKWEPTILKDSLVGRSLDDAAGEAFDKTAKLLGFPYPGGHHLDAASKTGDRKKYDFPRGLERKDNFDFSFSGLKTSVANAIQKNPPANAQDRADFAASIQEAILDSLISKTLRAAQEHRVKSIVIVGGVSANQRLRERMNAESKVPVFFPDKEFSTDQAAMIAAVGVNRFYRGEATSDFLELNGFAAS